MNKRYLSATLLYLGFLTAIVLLANYERAEWLFNSVSFVPFGDKLGHFILMGIFSFLLNSTFRCREISVRGFKLLLGSVIAFVMVLPEELSQVFIESRNLDVFDLIADVLGIYLFGILAKRWSIKQVNY